MAALNALVHLLHGRLAVFTAIGAAPEHEALYLSDVLFLHTFHHGVHRLLYLELPRLGPATRLCASPAPTWTSFVQFYIVS
jgi:hypothetical protein